MFKKLLIISGPTATGKTAVAAKLAKEFNGELISADSRQIYRGMNIGTGKDHPPDVPIHLIDIINPNESFSVAQYQRLAFAKIQEVFSKNKLPIVVGGTGQYIDSIIHPHQTTYSIPPNLVLRFFLGKLPVKFLQSTLRLLDLPAGRHGLKTFNSLNNSERFNRHRLIRKIEISLSPKIKIKMKNDKWLNEKFNILHLSLTAPNEFIYRRVDTRVQQRLQTGLLGEIKGLLSTYHWSAPGLHTLAYQEFRQYFKNDFSREACIQKWRFDEHGLVRRQKTWFKKQKNIVLVDITQAGYLHQITQTVNKWYNQS